MTPRTLVAGFGNVLRGDDGFGVTVVQAMEREASLDQAVSLMEVGTGGIGLVQALFDGYDRLIVVDAMARGEAPGTVSVLEVETVDEAREVDLHLATPSQALPLARSLGVLPQQVFLVGCEVAEVDELTMNLSPKVGNAVPRAVAEIPRLVENSETVIRSETPS